MAARGRQQARAVEHDGSGEADGVVALQAIRAALDAWCTSLDRS